MKQHGFTLIELLIVITVISILFLTVAVTLDPMRQFKEARNARRRSDIIAISTALSRYIIEKDKMPPGISLEEQQVGTNSSGCNNTCPNAKDSCINLFDEIKPYINIFPKEPSGGTDGQTGYSVQLTKDNAITVKACKTDLGASIIITR